MSRTLSNGQSLNAVVGRQHHDAGTNRFAPDEGLTTPMQDAVVRAAFALLTPEQLAEIVASRVLIERATGMLMLTYELDANNAFELLKWGSQTQDVNVRLLAEQLIEGLVRVAGSERVVELRSACDDVLFGAHERVKSESLPSHQPSTSDR